MLSAYKLCGFDVLSIWLYYKSLNFICRLNRLERPKMKRKGPGSAASDRRLANKKRKLEALLALTEAKGKAGMITIVM